MKKTKKLFKVLSLMLAFVMVLGLATVSYADETQTGTTDNLTMTDNMIGGTKETDYSIYIANDQAFLNVGAESASVYLSVDQRFFDVEDITMRLEVRQYENGYILIGAEEYTLDEMKELFKDAKEVDGCYVLDSVEIPINQGKEMKEGWNVYCTVQFTRPEWTDDMGNSVYRWTYTMTDAMIIGADKTAPSPIVWLYNLDANSYRGSVIREILADIEIKAGTINSENLNQNIGYLVEWEGYEPVANPYSSENYDVEYMLMGNLSEVQLDGLLNAMAEENIKVELKSIPTAWTAGKTFSELFEIMAEENETLKAAVALDQMIYTAEELDEATYGSSPYWSEFQEVLAEALIALQTDAEETGEGAALYLNARQSLEEMYLKVTGKVLLEGELELVCQEQEDGTYKVSAKLNGEIENPTFSYTWKPADSSEEASAESIVVKAEELYKVKLKITGTGNCYGELEAKLYVPSAPVYEVSSTKNSVSVLLTDNEKTLNTLETLGYVVELYLDGTKVHSQDVSSAQQIVFNGLTAQTEYVVKVNAYNAVGRSDIVESTIVTADQNEDTGSDADGSQDDMTDEDQSNTDQSGNENMDDTDAESDDTEGNSGDAEEDSETTGDSSVSPVTGDASFAFAWSVLIASLVCVGGCTVVGTRRMTNKR